MIISSKQAEKARLASLGVVSYMIRNEAKAVTPIFPGKWPKG
jgi:hypothetical protein